MGARVAGVGGVVGGVVRPGGGDPVHGGRAGGGGGRDHPQRPVKPCSKLYSSGKHNQVKSLFSRKQCWARGRPEYSRNL